MINKELGALGLIEEGTIQEAQDSISFSVADNRIFVLVGTELLEYVGRKKVIEKNTEKVVDTETQKKVIQFLIDNRKEVVLQGIFGLRYVKSISEIVQATAILADLLTECPNV